MDLPLSAFRPIARLRVRRAGLPARPRFPVIDGHNHLGPTPFSGPWATRDATALAAVMDAADVAAIVDLDGGWGPALIDEVGRWAPLGGRVAVFAGLDYAMWATRSDFGDEEARRLRAGVAAGARGLKVWKSLGLTARDTTGRLVAVDDPRLDPIWAMAAELAVPVTTHVADPIAFFEPLDATNERWEELHAHPDWHVWPPGSPDQGGTSGLPGTSGTPTFDELIDRLEAVVVRHPATTFIGAHVGCAAEDLARVATMLERCPNWYVDVAARIAELGRQPYTARQFIERWRDRVMFGTDAAPDPAWWATYEQVLETSDESIPYEPDGGPGSQGRWLVHGLGLPDDVLRAVYHGTARRLIFPGVPLPGLAAHGLEWGGRTAARPESDPPGVDGHRTFHLLPAERWEAWRDGPADAPYQPEGFERDGFVHCTDAPSDLVEVANAFYASDPRPQVVLELELGLAGPPWRYDDPKRRFPHVYGPLARRCVRSVAPFERGVGGRFLAIGRPAPLRP